MAKQSTFSLLGLYERLKSFVGLPIASTPIALTDLVGGASYKTVAGGLYPGGTNTPPAAHLAEGIAQAALVQPRDAAGNLDPDDGKIGVMGIGHSNSRDFWWAENEDDDPVASYTFCGQSLADPLVDNEKLVFMSACQGGFSAVKWAFTNTPVWPQVDVKVTAAGLTNAQVQVIWCKLTNTTTAGPATPVDFPGDNTIDQNVDAWLLAARIGLTIRICIARYPNLRFIFLSPRWKGHDLAVLTHPEPLAYESGFGVQNAVAAYLTEKAGGGVHPTIGSLLGGSNPTVSWGPYFWAEDVAPGRSDGLTWYTDDYQDPSLPGGGTFDGIHSSRKGAKKVADVMREFFLNSPFTLPWYLTGYVDQSSRWRSPSRGVSYTSDRRRASYTAQARGVAYASERRATGYSAGARGTTWSA
jgi:hypothetical protein